MEEWGGEGLGTGGERLEEARNSECGSTAKQFSASSFPRPFPGGFDVKGRHYALAMTLLLRRRRVVEDEPTQVVRTAAGAKGGKAKAG